MFVTRFSVFCLSVFLVAFVFLSVPLITRAEHRESHKCTVNTAWWYKRVLNQTAPGRQRTYLAIERVLNEIDTKFPRVTTALNELDSAINTYNASSKLKADRELVWVKFNETAAILTDFNTNMDDGYKWVRDPCADADSNAYFTGGTGIASRARLAAYMADNSFQRQTQQAFKDRLELARSRMPHFLFFDNFEYPLPGITGTIDRFIEDPVGNPVLRYINIVIVSVIAGIVAIALIMIVVAGYMYVTAGGNAQRVTTAKGLIGAALLGIVLVLGAFLILNTIGTQFASTLQEPTIPPP